MVIVYNHISFHTCEESVNIERPKRGEEQRRTQCVADLVLQSPFLFTCRRRRCYDASDAETTAHRTVRANFNFNC